MCSFVRHQLTRAILIQLFCRDGKNEKYFDHDFHNYICHIGSLWDLNIGIESSEKVLHPLKKFNECVLACLDSLDSLRYIELQEYEKRDQIEETHREEDSNARKDHRCRWEWLKNKCQTAAKPRFPRLTRPGLAPIIVENVYSTFTVGFRHFVSPSLLLAE